MKKSAFMLSLFLLFGFSFAQTSDIGNINAEFCNEGQKSPNLEISTETNVDNEICINFINGTHSDVKLQYGFVDGALTNGETQNRVCTDNDTINFGQFVKQPGEIINLPANSTVQQISSVNFPTGMNGIVNGCLVYSVVEEDETISKKEGFSFKIVVRKAAFITSFVGGELHRSLVLGDSINHSFKDKILNTKLSLYNSGNIDESVQFSGTISNIFGYSQPISETRTVESSSLYEMIIETENLPWYRGFFNISGTLISDGIIVFDKSLLSGDSINSIIIPVETTVFVFPWTVLCVILGFVLLCFVIRYISKHFTLKFHK